MLAVANSGLDSSAAHHTIGSMDHLTRERQLGFVNSYRSRYEAICQVVHINDGRCGMFHLLRWANKIPALTCSPDITVSIELRLHWASRIPALTISPTVHIGVWVLSFCDCSTRWSDVGATCPAPTGGRERSHPLPGVLWPSESP